MDFVLGISWSSLVLGIIGGCKMLSDVLLPVMACPEVLPDLDKLLEKSLCVCVKGKRQKTFYVARRVTKITAVDH